MFLECRHISLDLSVSPYHLYVTQTSSPLVSQIDTKIHTTSYQIFFYGWASSGKSPILCLQLFSFVSYPWWRDIGQCHAWWKEILTLTKKETGSRVLRLMYHVLLKGIRRMKRPYHMCKFFLINHQLETRGHKLLQACGGQCPGMSITTDSGWARLRLMCEGFNPQQSCCWWGESH